MSTPLKELTASLPDYYRAISRRVLVFSVWMMFLGLIAGILYAESGKKLALSGTFSPDLVFQGNYYLTLIHGHTFQLGTFIPVTVLGIIWLCLLVFGKSLTPKSLAWGFGLYCPSAFISIALLIYKAYFTQLSVRAGQTDLALIDHALYGGNHLVRTLAYAIPHTAFGIGLLILGLGLLRALKTDRVA